MKEKKLKVRKWFPKCRAVVFSHKGEKRRKTRERVLSNELRDR